MIDSIKIGERIRARRKELGLTQKQLAEVTALTHQTIARYESGEIKGIKLVVMEQLARYMDVNPAWLACKSEIKERSKDRTYLKEKDKADLYEILNAVLEYMNDAEDLTWQGKRIDDNMIFTIFNNIKSVQRLTNAMITPNALISVDDKILEINRKEREEPEPKLPNVEKGPSL